MPTSSQLACERAVEPGGKQEGASQAVLGAGDTYGVESRALSKAYHLGLPNFKCFLTLRYFLAVWSIFLGAFYEEPAGWVAGSFLLAVALGMTLVRIESGFWRFRPAMIGADIGVIVLVAVALVFSKTLIKSVYYAAGCFAAAQLLTTTFVYKSCRTHPLCFPSTGPSHVYNSSIAAQRREPRKPSSGPEEDYGAEDRKAWKMKRIPFATAWIVAFGVFLLMVAHSGQRLIIYPGTLFRVHIPNEIPAKLGLDIELVTFTTEDHHKLSAFFLKPTARSEVLIAQSDPELPRLTMWIFYGNTGNMVHQLDYIVPFFQQAYPNLQFFIFSYRGYANSDGRPHIAGLRHDIDAAVHYLARRKDVDPNRLVAYGHSIGGALVSDIIGRHPHVLKGVVLSNTFLSMYKMADDWKLSLFKPFITEAWDSEAAFHRAAAAGALPPLLFMTSRKDELIAPAHMDELHRIALQQPGISPEDCIRVELHNGTHNMWNDAGLCLQVWSSFFRRLSVAGPAAGRPTRHNTPNSLKPKH